MASAVGNNDTFLVTGASGFIGHYLVAALLKRGHTVKSLDLRPPKYVHDNLQFIEGSFLSLDVLGTALSNTKTIIHLAATKFPKAAQQDPKSDILENILGSFQLFEQAKNAGVQKIIYASSGGTVYGETEAVPINESQSKDPISAYGISKLAVEKYLQFFRTQHGIETVSLRASNPYGPGQNIQNSQGALTTFCYKALRGEPIEVWGDGTIERDYIFIADLVDAFVAAAEKHRIDETVLNIGSGRGTSLNTLIAEIQQHFSNELEVNYLSSRSFDVQRNFLNIDLASKAIGWKPNVTLEQGIAQTLNSMRQSH